MRRPLVSCIAVASMLATATHAQDLSFLYGLVDGNHDNQIDRSEVDAFASDQWRSVDSASAGVVSRDALFGHALARTLVGDMMPAPGATLTRSVFTDGLARRFATADENGDGVLDTAEFPGLVGAPPMASRPPTPPAPQYASLARPYAPGLPSCAALGRDPAAGLAGRAGVSSLFSRVIAQAGPDAAYCMVQFVYNSGRAGVADGYPEGQEQAITVRIGLPLRRDEGGDAIEWNGRIQNIGSGGCMGNVPGVSVGTNSGFASATTDGGHGAPWIAFNCGFAVDQANRRLNTGLIRDFTAEHVRWQTFWSKAVVETYYGQPAQRTYWSGCSQGGREGFIALQTLPDEYDGILAGGSALYWMRFQMAQAWSGLVIKDVLRSVGKDLSQAEIARTVRQEVAACDELDGLKDGQLDDPRQCRWSARAVICQEGEDPSTCLDADQARAFDMIRSGPRNHRGEMLWFPWEPGTTFSNQTNYLLSDGVMQWATRDLTFRSDQHLYLDQDALEASGDPLGVTYEDMATLASQRVSDLADVDDVTVDEAAASGVKMLSWTGTADRNIQSRNSLKYARDAAAHLGQDMGSPEFQDWFRTILYPNVDHCQGGDGPQPGNINNGPLFAALVRWVEEAEAPDRILATLTDATGAVVRTRPVCVYPQTARYLGSGSIDDAANFRCEGDLETQEIVAADTLAPHKMENGTGILPETYR